MIRVFYFWVVSFNDNMSNNFLILFLLFSLFIPFFYSFFPAHFLQLYLLLSSSPGPAVCSGPTIGTRNRDEPLWFRRWNSQRWVTREVRSCIGRVCDCCHFSKLLEFRGHLNKWKAPHKSKTSDKRCSIFIRKRQRNLPYYVA